ncbi:oxidoreductase [Agromyces rhizosphaerae]|uniref:Oxidoreductase n=1 Tax=Agromyces rhizosphaerae TaxID=88374 RepID=A0A9W6FPP0_9MICO|nr:FAD-dependent oxidoreductase [Agromyces rhizosphaerae]GLI27660.1 oxidoreductase [Agromyces rhizosphaerae]
MNTPVSGPSTTDRDAQRSTARAEGLAALANRLAGTLSVPGDPDWDAARQAWSLSADQHPAAVVHPVDVADVVHAVSAARELGLRIAPQSTGHNAGPLAAQGLGDTLLVRTSALDEISIDPARRVARIGGGTTWESVAAAAGPHGLMALAGSSHDVGVVGYTLGGGVSWFARSHGLAANHVLAIELVTPDGVQRRVDADTDPDLFWALRGSGGGGLGIVTALECRLFPITEVFAGMMLWPAERAHEVFTAWRDLTTTVPTTASTACRLFHFPDMPELPPFLAGRSVVVVDGVVQGTPEEGAALVAPLRALEPEMDTFGPTPVSELMHLHMDPPGPTPGTGDGILLDELPDAAIAAAIGGLGVRGASRLMFVELRHVGGALRPDEGASVADGPTGVLAGLDAEYVCFSSGMPFPDGPAPVRAALDVLFAGLAPWRGGLDYLNFAETGRDPERFWGADAPRLRVVRERVDPDGVMRPAHAIG